jgi:hypothetical protein
VTAVAVAANTNGDGEPDNHRRKDDEHNYPCLLFDVHFLA